MLLYAYLDFEMHGIILIWCNVGLWLKHLWNQIVISLQMTIQAIFSTPSTPIYEAYVPFLIPFKKNVTYLFWSIFFNRFVLKQFNFEIFILPFIRCFLAKQMSNFCFRSQVSKVFLSYTLCSVEYHYINWEDWAWGSQQVMSLRVNWKFKVKLLPNIEKWHFWDTLKGEWFSFFFDCMFINYP